MRTRARTHAAGGSGNPPHMFNHKPGLLLPFLWSKPHPDGDPALEDCDFLPHESHSLKRMGWRCPLSPAGPRSSPEAAAEAPLKPPLDADPEAPLKLTWVSQQGVTSRGVQVQGNTFFIPAPNPSLTLCGTSVRHLRTHAQQGTTGARWAPHVQPAGWLLAQPRAAIGAWPPCCWGPDSACRWPAVPRRGARQHPKPRLSR